MLKIDRQVQNGGIQRTIGFSNAYGENWDKIPVSYLKQVEDFAAQNHGSFSEIFFFVSESENQATKAAVHFMNCFEGANDEENDFFDDDLFEEDFACSDRYLVDFDMCYMDENNKFAKYAMPIASIEENTKVLFLGLTNEMDIKEKIECVEACKASLKCIWITPEQVNKPWVQHMMAMNRTKALKLLPLPKGYVKSVINYLLEDSGWTLDRGLSVSLLAQRMKHQMGNLLDEESIAWYLDQAANDRFAGILKASDFKMLAMDDAKALDVLSNMAGLKDMKEIARECNALLLESLTNEKMSGLHNNMIFYGNPGTGKTTCANLMARLFAETGVKSPVFVSCSRADLIGKYVGQTAPLVAKKFKDARGGVLFVDEAGFFLNQSSGGFVDEAIKEFVRYMELYPDVTVIFAMYDREVKGFLSLDDGLSSRISRMVHFPDYSEEELWEITCGMAKDKGYEVEAGCKEIVEKYISARKRKKSFGNARDIRKLIESCVVVVCLRHAEELKNAKKKKLDLCIKEQDMLEAIERLKGDVLKEETGFGFKGKTDLPVALAV